MRAEAEGRRAALQFRSEHRLGVQPLGDLAALIEQSTGIDVAILPAGPGEHGLTMRDPERDAVVIGIACMPHPMRQRSTLAHELAHVIFRDWGSAGDTGERSPQEVRADAFARHLLVPIEGVREVVEGQAADDAALSKVVQLFGVSPAIAAIALEQAGLIGADQKSGWLNGYPTWKIAARFGWSDYYRSLQRQAETARAPQKLVARLTRAYMENVVSVQTIARVRGTDANVLLGQLREAGIQPREQYPEWADATELPDVDVDLSVLDDEGSAEPEL